MNYLVWFNFDSSFILKAPAKLASKMSSAQVVSCIYIADINRGVNSVDTDKSPGLGLKYFSRQQN